MSSFIAVCVTFLGLALIIINVVVFLQMLLSFPAMLSSNSQAYVQQQRKLHHIPSSREDLHAGYADAPDAIGEDAEDEQEWETTERWADEQAVEVEEEEEDQYQADDCSSEVCVAPPRAVAAAARRSDSMTRGRPLRRQRRRYIARTVLRVKDIGRVRDSDYDSEFSEAERRPTVAGARSRDRAGHDCRGGWRGMDWTR